MADTRILVAVDLTLCMEALTPLQRVGDVDYLFPYDRARVLARIPEADAYMGHVNVRVDGELLDRGRKLRVLCTCSTGTDHIDKAALARRGVHLISLTTEYDLLDRFTSTAEMAWALLLTCRRKLPHETARALRGEVGPERDVVPPPQLSGKTLGLLGCGRLGRMMVEYGKAFRMRVLACDLEPIDIEGVRQVDFDALIAESDVLSLHIHLCDETRHIISRDVLGRMKPGAILVNTARGGLIDEGALIEALGAGPLAAAGLDVFQDEWDPDLANHPLFRYARTHDNLVITPHMGGASLESITEARIFIAQKLAEFLATGVHDRGG